MSKLTLRIPEDLHQKLRQMSFDLDISQNNILLAILGEKMKGVQLRKKKKTSSSHPKLKVASAST